MYTCRKLRQKLSDSQIFSCCEVFIGGTAETKIFMQKFSKHSRDVFVPGQLEYHSKGTDSRGRQTLHFTKARS